jgi:sulfotransferase
LEFEELTNYPGQTMKKIYDYLELPYYIHNFTNIVQVTKEDDSGVHRIPGLHDIRSTLESVPSDADKILGNFLLNKYSNLEIWRN